MAKAQQPEFINVHRVVAERPVIVYFRMGDPKAVEGFFFRCKRDGYCEFILRGKQYTMTKQQDGIFIVSLTEDRPAEPESYS